MYRRRKANLSPPRLLSYFLFSSWWFLEARLRNPGTLLSFEPLAIAVLRIDVAVGLMTRHVKIVAAGFGNVEVRIVTGDVDRTGPAAAVVVWDLWYRVRFEMVALGSRAGVAGPRTSAKNCFRNASLPWNTVAVPFDSLDSKRPFSQRNVDGRP